MNLWRKIHLKDSGTACEYNKLDQSMQDIVDLENAEKMSIESEGEKAAEKVANRIKKANKVQK